MLGGTEVPLEGRKRGSALLGDGFLYSVENMFQERKYNGGGPTKEGIDIQKGRVPQLIKALPKHSSRRNRKR